jgi:hypothetical protein
MLFILLKSLYFQENLILKRMCISTQTDETSHTKTLLRNGKIPLLFWWTEEIQANLLLLKALLYHNSKFKKNSASCVSQRHKL